ncbi:MAG: tRNA (adenosine(37)-N6)-dimethylallyltransferase MiaA [Gemmatimonadaceae bacterium]
MAAAELRVICGPTAAGKSAIALEIARRYDAVIISADSRQIYRGFDVGTAKPTPAERVAVLHRGLDLVDPFERYSAALWAESAHGWLHEAASLGRTPVVVGGTGFYIRSLVAPLFDEPPLDAARRRALLAWLEILPTSELRRWCRRLDLERAHLGRTQLLRALEIALATGIPISAWYRERAPASSIAARYLLVDPGPVLAERIARRVHAMLESGWTDEVRALAERVCPDAPAWNATGYRAVLDLVHGRLTHQAAVERITIQTRQYARRQRTWFRHQLPQGSVTPLDPNDRDAASTVRRWWEHGLGETG